MPRKRKEKQTAQTAIPGSGGNDEWREGESAWIDPLRVRFQHARIRPCFSCGRSVLGTLEEIRRGEIKPTDLPPIQVCKELTIAAVNLICVDSDIIW
jgi:hypothetical protein